MKASLLILLSCCLLPSVATVAAADSNSTNSDKQQDEEKKTTESDKTVIPFPTTTVKEESDKPDHDCLFKPELPKCSSHGQDCPPGFNNNEDDNCFPQHDKCPKGFHSHEDDETGRCISDRTPCDTGYIRDPSFPTCSKKESVCRDHPSLAVCGNQVIVIKNIIHKHSNNSNHGLSKDCFDAIKIAWFGKVERGQNNEVDKFIDKCLT